MTGNPQTIRHRRERKLSHNVAQPAGRAHRLACGHETYAEHVVAGTVGKPKLYRCPEGCQGLQRRAT